MNSKIINSKEISDRLTKENIGKVNSLKIKGISPKIACIRIGEDVGSISYEKNITKTLTACGIYVQPLHFSADICALEIVKCIDELNEDSSVHGILLFKPIPQRISDEIISNAIDPSKDVDGITPENLGKLVLSQKTFYPCSPEAVMEALDFIGVELKGKNVTIVNSSNIFGKPLSIMLTNRNASVSICHEHTDDIGKYTRSADIVVTACGVTNLINSSMLKSGAIVIDAGIAIVETKQGEKILCGDVSDDCVSGDFILCSKTRGFGGGIGPITTAILARHVLESAEKR